MSETIGVNILKRASDMTISPQFNGYSGVRIYIGTDDDGNEVVYESGVMTGQVLEIKNPFGTQEMADNILADIQGYQYQPLTAENALLDPAAEMGDGVTVNGVYSGIFIKATQFGRLMASDIEAPTDEEIEHEFAIESASDRQYTRFVQQTKAMLKITNMAITAEVEARESADTAINSQLAIQATQIQAKVSKQSPDGQTTFGWNLTDSEWTVFSGNSSNTILRASASGLEVKGKVTATSGEIGGFTIGATSIFSNGMEKMDSTQSTGVHLGTDGIKLGQNFEVSTSGVVKASSLQLRGSIDFYDSNGTWKGSLTAADLKAQVSHSYGSTTSGGYCYGGAGHGYSYNNATISSNYAAPYFYVRNALACDGGIACSSLSARSGISCSSLSVGGYGVSLISAGSASYVLGIQ